MEPVRVSGPRLRGAVQVHRARIRPLVVAPRALVPVPAPDLEPADGGGHPSLRRVRRGRAHALDPVVRAPDRGGGRALRATAATPDGRRGDPDLRAGRLTRSLGGLAGSSPRPGLERCRHPRTARTRVLATPGLARGKPAFAPAPGPGAAVRRARPGRRGLRRRLRAPGVGGETARASQGARPDCPDRTGVSLILWTGRLRGPRWATAQPCPTKSDPREYAGCERPDLSPRRNCGAVSTPDPRRRPAESGAGRRPAGRRPAPSCPRRRAPAS